MPYTVLRGEFVIRYADLPRQGPQPDGDTIKFRPDLPALVETLPRRSGRPARLNARGVSVRLEAIDALETHFGETHQMLAGANAARDQLLAGLGFTNVTYFTDLPNTVERADQDRLPGYVLSNGIDANGRVIGFVYTGSPPAGDGASVFLDEDGVDASVNATLLADGWAYPAFYGTLPASLRTHLAQVSRSARAAGKGVWPDATADPAHEAEIADLAALETLVIWPKLFRRLVPYLAAGNTTFDGFDTWLRADPVDRDDSLLLLDPPERGNLHDIVKASGKKISLTRWPEDFIIEPDPAPAGTTTGPRRYAAGDVVLIAVLPDPVGADAGHETASLANVTATDIDLRGWKIADGFGRHHDLDGALSSGEILRVRLGQTLVLGNRGGSLTLTDASGSTIDQLSYTQAQVQRGRTLVFGRS